MQKSYYAIIPADVRYSDLTPNAKLLYGEITALCNEKGYCWASNDYFAVLYGVSNVSISKWVNALVKQGYITSEITFQNGDVTSKSRCLRIVKDHTLRKVKDPLKEKFIYNTTVNTTDIYISEEEFLDVWSRARKFYDKKETNISKLSTNERGNFNDLVKDYNKKDFEHAVAGLFFQDTLPNVRVRPTHFLDRQYFETYLDCWRNNTKIYNKQKKKNDNTGMI
jgi:hypothetical protein